MKYYIIFFTLLSMCCYLYAASCFAGCPSDHCNIDCPIGQAAHCRCAGDTSLCYCSNNGKFNEIAKCHCNHNDTHKST